MKKWTIFATIILGISLMSACSPGDHSSSENELIEPGDKIGNFLITSGIEGEFTYSFYIQCSELSNQYTYSCDATVGSPINVSTGIYDQSGGSKLNEVWTNSQYEMYIDDHPVDLKSFGTIDYTHPTMGKIRFANVVISTDQPGEITVRDSGVFETGEPFTSTSNYNFRKP
jgi:hypothetical protein